MPDEDTPGRSRDAVVQVRGLHYHVGAREIFAGVDLEARRGRITSVMGPSGTGKTTLLRLITGQVAPEQGSVEVFGQEVTGLDTRGLYGLRRRMGMLFQNGALLTDLSVFENVAFPVREHARLPEPVLRQLVLTKLHAVGLRGAADMMPAQLSGGQLQRSFLSRALGAVASHAGLMLADEPTAALDFDGQRAVAEELATLPVSLLVVTHDRAVAQRCDRVLEMAGGQLREVRA